MKFRNIIYVNAGEMATYRIKRKDIESFDHGNILAYLNVMKADARRYEGKLNIVIDGYLGDPRELYEIREVRDYIAYLDKCFPYWFYFCYRGINRISPYFLLVPMLVPSLNLLGRNSEIVSVDIGPDAFPDFMEKYYVHLNDLTDELGLSDAENERISREVAECLFALFG